MEQDILVGAGEGYLFIASENPNAKKPEDRHTVIIISPEGAENMALELPRLAQLARNLKAQADPETDDLPSPVPDGTLNQMAAKLVQAGYIWRGGWWSRKGEDYVGRAQPYPQATVKTFKRLNGAKGKTNGN